MSFIQFVPYVSPVIILSGDTSWNEMVVGNTYNGNDLTNPSLTNSPISVSGNGASYYEVEIEISNLVDPNNIWFGFYKDSGHVFAYKPSFGGSIRFINDSNPTGTNVATGLGGDSIGSNITWRLYDDHIELYIDGVIEYNSTAFHLSEYQENEFYGYVSLATSEAITLIKSDYVN